MRPIPDTEAQRRQEWKQLVREMIGITEESSRSTASVARSLTKMMGEIHPFARHSPASVAHWLSQNRTTSRRVPNLHDHEVFVSAMTKLGFLDGWPDGGHQLRSKLFPMALNIRSSRASGVVAEPDEWLGLVEGSNLQPELRLELAESILAGS